MGRVTLKAQRRCEARANKLLRAKTLRNIPTYSMRDEQKKALKLMKQGTVKEQRLSLKMLKFMATKGKQFCDRDGKEFMEQFYRSLFD